MKTKSSIPKKKKRRWGRELRNWLVGIVGPFIVRAWIRTVRVRVVGDMRLENGVPIVPEKGIFVFWHQRLLMLAGHFRDSGFRALISQHGDGEMIARVIGGLGMTPIRGSSTRGGARACLEILRDKDTEGRLNIGITPDGPRGPRHVFQEGAIFLASRTGLPLYPIVVSARRFARLPTWDGLMLPWPFTRAVIQLGEPILVPPDLDREGIERIRQEAEASLRKLTEANDFDVDELYRQSVRV